MHGNYFFFSGCKPLYQHEKEINSISIITDLNRHPKDSGTQYLTILQKRSKIKAVQYIATKVFTRLLSILQGRAERFRDIP